MATVGNPAVPFKIVMLGDSGVGKTSMCNRWLSDEFDTDVVPTLGAFFKTKTVTIQDHPVDICLCDTAGQEQYRSITPLYMRSASSVIITASMDVPSSFENIQVWLSILKESALDAPPAILAINKVDLADNENIVERAQKFKSCVTNIVTCSAKTGEGIDALFSTAAYIAYEFSKKHNLNDSDSTVSAAPEEKHSSCC